MNPLSPQTREMLARLDTVEESKIPISDMPRPIIAETNGVADPVPEPPSPPVATTPPEPKPDSQPELMKTEPSRAPEPRAEAPAPAPVKMPEPPLSSAQDDIPFTDDGPPLVDEPVQSASYEGSMPSDGDAPPLRDDDGPVMMDEGINFDEMEALVGGPPINHHEPPAPRSRPQFGSAPGGAGGGPGNFPPNLELNHWYRLVLDQHNRPVAILDHAKNKAVHSYAIPPERLNFKIGLSSLLEGAAATYRAPLPVGEMTERMDRMKFCFESRPGDEGTKLVMKILPEATDPADPAAMPQILEGKVFKGPPGGGLPAASSLPAVAGASGFSSAPRSTAGANGKRVTSKSTLTEKAMWLEDHKRRRQGMRH